ncbi:hypothetical protein HMPREF1624_05434 [Sporothrix schenckii ATCC 58251]|uniref:EthD domain-containing protein n=1 Tax=Sporothrix schenckii (strain ATCC 58251 / de Perez 2211183) TaxID=1391915 RepID=U7PSR6_SPOS1|nr:hypothetical protein HMPREF1624_05434 [Sporothrix schenckii ATCC 58251]
MDTGDIKGPGLLFVQSRITRPDIMTEDVFMHWYDTDHIAEVIETTGVDSAIRWKHDQLATAPLPYLSIYPLEDIAFLRTDEFKAIRVTSDLLPGSKLCYDLASFDVGYYNIVQVADPTAKGTNGTKGKGLAKSLVAEQIETSDAAGLHAWYKTAYLPALAARLPGYLRTTRYELKYARSNDQSRRFKGLSSTDAPPPTRPTWLAIHEFSTDAGAREADLQAVQASASGFDAVKAAAKVWQSDLYHFAKSHGKGELFHGREF